MGGSAAPSLYRCIRWEGAQRGNHGKSSSAAIQFRARHGCGAAEVALSGCLRDTFKRRRDLGRHACKDYMYKGGVEVGVDEKRWKEVLKAAESMLIWGKPPPSVFFNSSRQLREEADARAR